MQPLKKTTSARIVAVGFIIIIICGNFWFASSFLDISTVRYWKTGMHIGIVTVILGGIGLVFEKIFPQIINKDSQPECTKTEREE
ncbi:MAG: hypothetical protein R3B45_03340 [Bdellovibrionota bacterium]